MGAFRKPKYQETAADKAVREDIERRRKEELKQQAEMEAKEKKFKRRKAKGMVGMRSLFTRAGGRGYFQEGEEK
jgi:epoxyqueuosine reductase QueG|tara:strand:- start:332 stop:553 length:222 start_codon:yes stop_codon:yes gene_type:complete